MGAERATHHPLYTCVTTGSSEPQLMFDIQPPPVPRPLAFVLLERGQTVSDTVKTYDPKSSLYSTVLPPDCPCTSAELHRLAASFLHT